MADRSFPPATSNHPGYPPSSNPLNQSNLPSTNALLPTVNPPTSVTLPTTAALPGIPLRHDFTMISGINVFNGAQDPPANPRPRTARRRRERAKEPPRFFCQVPDCKKAFRMQGDLHAHMRVHTGEEPFVCPHPYCNKRYKWRSSLSHHEKLHRSGKNPISNRRPRRSKATKIPRDAVAGVAKPRARGRAQASAANHAPPVVGVASANGSLTALKSANAMQSNAVLPSVVHSTGLMHPEVAANGVPNGFMSGAATNPYMSTDMKNEQALLKYYPGMTQGMLLGQHTLTSASQIAPSSAFGQDPSMMQPNNAIGNGSMNVSTMLQGDGAGGANGVGAQLGVGAHNAGLTTAMVGSNMNRSSGGASVGISSTMGNGGILLNSSGSMGLGSVYNQQANGTSSFTASTIPANTSTNALLGNTVEYGSRMVNGHGSVGASMGQHLVGQNGILQASGAQSGNGMVRNGLVQGRVDGSGNKSQGSIPQGQVDNVLVKAVREDFDL